MAISDHRSSLPTTEELLHLAGKGSISFGADADLVALDATGRAQTVIIRGTMHVLDGELLRRGTFEHQGPKGAS
ncbi:MAG: hypothetical protein KGL25_12865 [Gammaproteobacteria bacterium]|nr:hypothetical protein [Gammaproteobacteria bacterium]MDE2252284.1 hypothetical protein [Gammaproteobacteria bacterium]